MRLAAKRDTNEREIVSALRKAGCQVIRGTDIDLIVTLGKRVELMEVKGPNGRLTPAQERLLARGVPLHIVHTPEEALEAMGLMDALVYHLPGCTCDICASNRAKRAANGS